MTRLIRALRPIFRRPNHMTRFGDLTDMWAPLLWEPDQTGELR